METREQKLEAALRAVLAELRGEYNSPKLSAAKRQAVEALECEDKPRPRAPVVFEPEEDDER